MSDLVPTEPDVLSTEHDLLSRPTKPVSATDLDSLVTRAPSNSPETTGPFSCPDTCASGTLSFAGVSGDLPGPIPGDLSGSFPGFSLLETLGQGGMGVVYKARQNGLNRPVALKVILNGRHASARELIRFLWEAEAVASIKHPNIVQVYEFGTVEDRPFLAMECLGGGSLADRLGRVGKFEPDAAARLLAKLAGAVQAAHDQGIIHRDLKPANVLFNSEGEPKVTDFGLAKLGKGTDLTQTQDLIGTPAYMSPEQAQGQAKFAGPRSDIYALGVILYECLTGVRPFVDDSIFALLAQIVDETPKSPRHHVPALPRDLELIALKCLEKSPADRYPTAEALAEDLRRYLAGEPILARKSSVARLAWLWCRRNPLPAALLTTLLAVGLVGTAVVARSRLLADREREEKSLIADYLSDRVLAESSTELNPRGAQFTVRELLDRVGSRIGGDFQDHPELKASVHETVGKSYLSLGEYTRAEAHLRAAMALDVGLRGPVDRASIRVANFLAVALEQSGLADKAEVLLRENLAAGRRSLGADDPITLEASARLGALLRGAGKLDEAERLIGPTLQSRRIVLPADHPDTLRSVRDLCLLEVDRRHLDRALSLADEYERGIRCARGPKHPDNVTAQANLGLIQLLRGHVDRAEMYYRRAVEEARRILGDDHPITRAAIVDHDRVAGQVATPPSSPRSGIDGKSP